MNQEPEPFRYSPRWPWVLAVFVSIVFWAAVIFIVLTVMATTDVPAFVT
jgi:hypothetical protein